MIQWWIACALRDQEEENETVISNTECNVGDHAITFSRFEQERELNGIRSEFPRFSMFIAYLYWEIQCWVSMCYVTDDFTLGSEHGGDFEKDQRCRSGSHGHVIPAAHLKSAAKTIHTRRRYP
jgi:hypothetical protein